jgi:TRAP-type uncharacterized transport system fused permease subunit
MMPNPVYVAYGGVALAAAAAVVLFLVVFFGELFLKSERELRSWMDTILWCMVGGLLVTAAVTAWIVARLHH